MREIKGMGDNSVTITNKHGAKQSKTEYRFDLFPMDALFAAAAVLAEGEIKYPAIDGVPNWTKIPVNEHLNHALTHINAHIKGDRQEDHLPHAICRLMFAFDVLAKDKTAAKEPKNQLITVVMDNQRKNSNKKKKHVENENLTCYNVSSGDVHG